MKIFIALALVSVALASPVIEPVQLADAPLPAMEAMPYIPMPEPIDIRPAFIPVEVLEALRLQEVPAEILAEVAHIEAGFEALKSFVPADEIPVEPLKIVDVAENIEPVRVVEVAENIELARDAEVAENIEPVKIVEVAENIDPVRVVEVADNIEAAADSVDAVKVVDGPLRYPGKVYDNPMLR